MPRTFTREFALQGGADTVSASLWLLSVNGLLLPAAVGLLKPSRALTRRAVWLAFLLGIALSLAANIAAAPALEWKPVLVAGWTPDVLLLSVELLVHRRESIGEVEESERLQEGGDPWLVRARTLDACRRQLHQPPVSAKVLRKELDVGAHCSGQLTALVM
ncbi:hypothetical protein [Streptomyces sp. NBC_00268]|uniref:hypothetical protein n=1 Tax=Streptomyces sp. NBC_00268 TaxID=2975695 RepID=UPI00224CC020|nr:hypothetical protein [Streptomyces sp. NBC_00268]MCX5184254.1 hypothetical protein [Streptomyces sp. NBC_00268]